MAEIDAYNHEVIGIVECPSTYEIVPFREHRSIPIYRLLEDAFDGKTISGKSGDLLLGGGSGESAALLISIPEAIHFLTKDNWSEIENIEDVYNDFWGPNDAYVFCDGYIKLGWKPDVDIRFWLVTQIIDFVLDEYPGDYDKYKGSKSIDVANKICRLPSENEKNQW